MADMTPRNPYPYFAALFAPLLALLLLAAPAHAAEILVKAIDTTHADANEDRRGCYKRGMPVVIKPDGHEWGSAERLPKFVVLKIPGVSVATVTKYIFPEVIDGSVPPMNYRRRLWQIRWADLPLAARNKLASDGELTIKVGAYAGAYDYTWAQIKGYFRNLKTGLDETADL